MSTHSAAQASPKITAEPDLLAGPSTFDSFFLGGFECATQRRYDGRRLDLLASTQHDAHAACDYRQMREHGIRTVRDGLRWHLIETAPGRYDWSSFLPMLRAAHEGRMQVIWDLCHYGWPDHVNIWQHSFTDNVGRFAAAAARVIQGETGAPPLYCPVNEISYWAWAGGEVGRFNPLAHRRGGELKRQLVRASIAAIEAVRGVDARARIVHAEPAIHVSAPPDQPQLREHAELYRLSQFEAFDMLSGRLQPELGGRPEYLDLVGVNYYCENQWYLHGGVVPMGHHLYRPFRDMLAETYARYRRPLLVAETGAEGTARPAWLHYVAEEVNEALDAGVPVEGICLYPVLDYPGWDDDRPCAVGLLGAPADGLSSDRTSSEKASDETGRRCYAPLAEELRRLQVRADARRPSGGTHTRRTAARLIHP